MPLIDVTHLLQVADRAAYQYEQIADAFEVIRQQGLAYYWEIVSDTDDVDVEVPTEKKYEEVDDDLETDRAVKYGTSLGNVIVGMEAHFTRKVSGVPLQLGGWDGYLTDNDERVSQYFGELFFAVKGYYMLANNVFSEGDDTFGTAEVIAGPAIQFTDGVNYGNGSQQNPANGTYFAATQLRAKTEVAIGGTNLDLRLSVKDINDNPTTIDVTIPAGTPSGTFIDVGGTSDRFLDVTNIDFVPAGSQGTLGDEVTIRNKKERQIAL